MVNYVLLRYHRGKVYCGAVASGENGGANIIDGATDLYAHVFEMTDPLGSATFNSTPILSYPLNYAVRDTQLRP